jgi:hypothetical protein
MPRVLEIVFFALLFGGALLPWPWNGAATAILVTGSLIWAAGVAFIETREWLHRRRLRRAAWL